MIVQAITRDVEGVPLVTLRVDGALWWIAGNLSTVLRYADPKHISRKIAFEWAEEFEEGRHYRVLQRADLAAFKAALVTGADTSQPPLVDGRTKSLTVLMEPGLWKVLLVTEQAWGRKLREVLASEVLPALARGGSAAGSLRLLPSPVVPLPPRFKAVLSGEGAEKLRVFALRIGREPGEFLQDAVNTWVNSFPASPAKPGEEPKTARTVYFAESQIRGVYISLTPFFWQQLSRMAGSRMAPDEAASGLIRGACWTAYGSGVT